MNNWLFYGIFLDENPQEIILKKARELVHIPDNWKIYSHHLTLIYNDGKNIDTSFLDKQLGKEVELQITSIGKSSVAIAFEVDYKTSNKHSHITVACAPGIPPVKSNFITRWDNIKSFSVKGKINVVRPR